jgi:galactokinase
MYESHRTLRDDFEVSCAELDALVEIAADVDGVFGSRMTGGGFGGCTVTLVRDDQIHVLAEKIDQQYAQRTGRRATCFATRPADGAVGWRLDGQGD